jgi:uncharacterized protein
MQLLNEELTKKWKTLSHLLMNQLSVGVALSGGVDSALVACAAVEALGVGKVTAFTIASPVEMPEELETAQQITKLLGMRHEVIYWNDLDTPGFAQNPVDRCYWCKKERLAQIKDRANALGIYSVCDGSNQDDGEDYRPGRRALTELGVLSPLALAGVTKADVRVLAQWKGLPVWDKPSHPCLATRIPYRTQILLEDLQKVSAAEAWLSEQGFSQNRVRLHGDLARIEVPFDELERLIPLRKKLLTAFKELGILYITLDLQGFRSGSMNEGMKL